MTSLNQIIAVEKGMKTRVTTAATKLYQTLDKTALFHGLIRTYQPIDDEGEQLPDESQKVQNVASEGLALFCNLQHEYWDLVATKEWANTQAKADIVVDGQVLASNVPVTYLLFLEKRLEDFRSFISHLPTLDPSTDWNFDAVAGLWKSVPVKTARSVKRPRVIVKYPATTEHEAQTELIQEDQLAGYWTRIVLSGAEQPTRVDTLLRRVNALLDAVKSAREQANNYTVTDVNVAGGLIGWLVAP